MNLKHRYLATVVLLAAGGTAMTSATSLFSRRGPGGDAKSEVKIDNFTFAPGEITVAKGTTVNWVNRDDIPHTVVSDDKTTFKSKPLDTDDKFSYTFSKEGTYTYFCSIHPKMTAKVVVK
ncbi:MAG TPA: cupredoxin family copper-binding protein [Candidatus Acidoferrum sp.]|nr:cupredoxin family copper-binding protein [Candidatus Acidoferrum sp.]